MFTYIYEFISVCNRHLLYGYWKELELGARPLLRSRSELVLVTVVLCKLHCPFPWTIGEHTHSHIPSPSTGLIFLGLHSENFGSFTML